MCAYFYYVVGSQEDVWFFIPEYFFDVEGDELLLAVTNAPHKDRVARPGEGAEIARCNEGLLDRKFSSSKTIYAWTLDFSAYVELAGLYLRHTNNVIGPDDDIHPRIAVSKLGEVDGDDPRQVRSGRSAPAERIIGVCDFAIGLIRRHVTAVGTIAIVGNIAVVGQCGNQEGRFATAGLVVVNGDRRINGFNIPQQHGDVV